MVTLQAKQQPPSQQQQQQQQQHLHHNNHHHHQQPSPQLQHRYERAAEEDTWNGLQQHLTCDNNNGSNQNGRGEVAPREDWAIPNNLKINNEDEEARRAAEVANFQETTSSRSRKDAGSCGTVAPSSNNNGNNQNAARREFNPRNDDWSISNNLKSINNKEADNRSERRVANFREETTSSRSGKDGESTQCSDIEDDDDVEIEEDELEEEEEEEEGNYQVDEVDTEDDEDDDDEDDKDVGNQVEKSDRWIKKKVVTTRVQHQTSFGESFGGQSEVVPQLDETTFGEVSITNSKHVHVGNTNFYKGPVTIKQFVYTNAYPVLDKEDDTEGSSSARVSDINPNDVPIINGNANGPILPSYQDYDTVTKWLWTWRCAAILCVVALILVTLVAVISVLLTKSDERPRLPNKLPESPDSGSEELPTSVRIIEREFWNAQPPSTTLDPLRDSPTPYVIISHTATVPCETQSKCVLRVRLIQTLHIESFGWDDIGYNFLIGGDGLAYMGRGWDLAGSHAFGYNYNSIGISFIGTFNDVAPNALQLNAAQKLIEYGLNISKIAPNYKLLGHRQVSKTLSPGDQLYNILQTWDHWSPYPKPESMSAGNALKPHPVAVLLTILIVTLPHLLQILQRSSRIFSRAARGFCNIVCSTHRLSYLLR